MATEWPARDDTLGRFLERIADEFGSLPALNYKPDRRTQTWTYRQVLAGANQVAAWLQEQGVAKGDRVVIWSPNNPWWVLAYFGTLRIGAIVVPLDVRSSPEFVERVVSQTEPRLAFVSKHTLAQWTYDAPAYVLDEVLPSLPAGHTPVLPEVEAGDIAEIIFTSGTTGVPKGVILTHNNIRTNVEASYEVFPSMPSFRILSILPLSHMFEQVAGLLLGLRGGASITYCPSVQPGMVFRAIRENHITTMLVVPRVLQMFLSAIDREVAERGKQRSWDRSQAIARFLPMRARRVLFRSVHRQFGGSLGFFCVGGAPVESELERRWELLGVAVLQGYGSTETSPVVASSSLSDHKPRSVGKPLPGVEVKLTPDHEILVRGPNVTPGYWQNPEATAAVFEDGWYHTGDVGDFDAHGYLYLRGRKKDLIVLSSGKKVYPSDVEGALRQVEGLRDSVVLPLPAASGPEVHAVLLLEPGADAAAIVREANRHLAPHQSIRGYTVWSRPDFPRTHTEKIRRQDVLQVVLTERGGEKVETARTAREEARHAELMQIVAGICGRPAGELKAYMTLADLGLDSLAFVQLAAAVEASFGMFLDEAQMRPETTLDELEAGLAVKPRGIPSYPNWPLNPVVNRTRRLLHYPIFAVLSWLCPGQSSGRENLEGVELPAILVANHVSHLDAAVIIRALPIRLRRRLTIAAARDTRRDHPWLAAAVSLVFNGYRFLRRGAIRASLERSCWLIDHDWSILIFPEGDRSATGVTFPFKPGIGMMAVEFEAPVIPIFVEGLERVLPVGQRRPRRGAVTVRFGEPLRFGRDVSYQQAAADIEQAVRLLDRRDVTSPSGIPTPR
jgi:long-chain acyl-CoA synthetase